MAQMGLFSSLLGDRPMAETPKTFEMAGGCGAAYLFAEIDKKKREARAGGADLIDMGMATPTRRRRRTSSGVGTRPTTPPTTATPTTLGSSPSARPSRGTSGASAWRARPGPRR
jgi:hypothetical protein